MIVLSKTGLGLTCEGAVGSDVVNDEAGGKHEHNHEQFGPGEPTTTHLYLQVLETGEEIRSKNPSIKNTIKKIVLWLNSGFTATVRLTWHRLLQS